MKANKKIISDLKLCYCVAPLTYKGEKHFLVASEKEYSCLLFDRNGQQIDEVWTGPGGTMSIAQVPGVDGAFLATHRFYSPNNSKESTIVLCWPQDGEWKIKTVAALPCVHRFDIIQRDGVNYLLACTIKKDYEEKDDWRFPGATYACRLPESLFDLAEGELLSFEMIKDNMLKNHGYTRSFKDGVQTGIVASDEGVFRFTPPANGEGDWTVEQLIADPTSDAVLVDLNGDGVEELLAIGPFHGDTLRIYEKDEAGYHCAFEYEEKIEFAHAITGGFICNKNRAIIGHRKGKRDLLSITGEGSSYAVEVLEKDIGSTNVFFDVIDGKDILISANREINEVAYYTLTED